MKSEYYLQIIKNKLEQLERQTDKIWYKPLIAVLAFLDNFIIIIPTDAILIASTASAPKKWSLFAFIMALGSTAGAILLAYLISVEGLPIILKIFPGINQTEAWIWSNTYLTKYGLVFIFLISLTPMTQGPSIILAALAHISLIQLSLVVFTGRLLKFLILAKVATLAPKYFKNNT
jgi:membrane protein YqaA with SNARE-associated domain